jgi:hydroxymethylglutaryl-CoA lyase
MAALAAIAARRDAEGGPPISATFSVAFGCPFDGEVSQDLIVALAREAASLNIAEIALADTIGVADPWTVRARVEAVKAVIGTKKLRLHFHDTRNTGLANAYSPASSPASTSWTPAVGGLGGCPFAPDATGNIGTEDLVYMLERAGLRDRL